jgi:hypothetical protein
LSVGARRTGCGVLPTEEAGGSGIHHRERVNMGAPTGTAGERPHLCRPFFGGRTLRRGEGRVGSGQQGHKRQAGAAVPGASLPAPNTAQEVAMRVLRAVDFDSVSAPAGELDQGTADLDPSMQTVRFGLNYRF